MRTLQVIFATISLIAFSFTKARRIHRGYAVIGYKGRTFSQLSFFVIIMFPTGWPSRLQGQPGTG